MTNSAIRDLLIGRMAAAVASAAAVQNIAHLGQRGRAREIFVEQLLEPFLLPGQIVVTGLVVDEHGNQSNQSDVIIFDRSIAPPELFDEREGLFPVEACAYVIEVKSKLTSQELRDAVTKGERLMSLQPLVNGARPVHALFAFQSDLSGVEMLGELERYLKLDSDPSKHPAVPVMCVASKGYACLNARDETKWSYMNSDENLSGVANFLGGFANTLPNFRKIRNSVSLPYGHYMLDTINFDRLPRR